MFELDNLLDNLF